MRGKVVTRDDEETVMRITPAYAGKRICRRCTHASMWDHPRLCGEKLFEFGNSGFMMGSPPPMRGKGTCRGYSKTGSGDHPRLCGEKHT